MRWLLIAAGESLPAEPVASPWVLVACGVILASLGLWFMLRWSRPEWRGFGLTLAVVGFVALGWPIGFGLGDQIETAVFWTLAAVTMMAALATISSRSPVYAAVWFAVSLLGTGGLFMFQGAQFLGVATVVVYAGAILVTFLFVLMLAEPRGRAYYDRISWGPVPMLMAVLSAATLMGAVALAASRISDWDVGPHAQRSEVRSQRSDASRISHGAVGPHDNTNVMDPQHVARLGGQLFTRHLIAVEIAGTLLLAALVGAVAIILAGSTAHHHPDERRTT
jgi:NADH-quinone oxidoreductase subunit J